jgi:glycosyltransferase involved in cell wall biosynthesis
MSKRIEEPMEQNNNQKVVRNIIFFMGFAIGGGANRGVCGPEVRFLENCRHMDTQKIHPLVIYPEFGQLIDDFKILDQKGRISLISYVPQNRRDYVRILYQVLKKNKSDAIHIQGPKLFDAIGVILGAIFSVKTFVTRPVNITQDHLRLSKKILFLILDQISVKFADQLIAISNIHKRQWTRELTPLGYQRKLIEEKTRVIYNGVDLGRFTAPQVYKVSSPIVFAIVAQLTGVKGHKLLLKVAQQLVQEGFQFKLLIVGDGPLKQELETWCVDNNVSSSQVEFKGMIKQVETILKSVDVVVLPSMREGLALSLIEGMASGCALIATDVGASSELVENEKNGFLIEKNNFSALYNAMKAMILEPDKVLSMKQNSVTYSAKYDLHKMVREYQDLYLEMTSDTSS